MTDKREVVRRLRAGDSIRQVSRELGLSRNTVRGYERRARELGLLEPGRAFPEHEVFQELWGEDALEERLPRAESKVAEHEAVVKDLAEKGVDATVIHEVLTSEHDFSGSYSIVQRYVRGLRGDGIGGVVARVETAPGEEAQVDFGFLGWLRPKEGAEPRKTWVFVMTLSYSRHMFAWLVQDQNAATWQDLHRRAFRFFGGVPRSVVADNLKAAVVRACYDDPEVQRGYRECAEHYGFLIRPARVRKPRDKGKVERQVPYVRNSYWKGRDHELLGDAQEALTRWTLVVAGRRRHGTTRKRPLEAFEAVERAHLLPLPPCEWEPRTYKIAKVHPDCHVQVDGAYYSAPCRLKSKSVLVQASSRLVALFFDGHMVATHLWGPPGTRRTNPDHIPPEKVRFYVQTPDWCRRRAHEIGPCTAEVIEDLLAVRPVDRLRTVQGILALADRFTSARLEAACRRGLHFGDARRHTLRVILDKGLDFDVIPDERRVQPLPFARFTRTAAEIFGQGAAPSCS
jgi:transposase